MGTLCSLIATYGSSGLKSNDTVPLNSGFGASSTTFFSFGGGFAFLAFGSGRILYSLYIYYLDKNYIAW